MALRTRISGDKELSDLLGQYQAVPADKTANYIATLDDVGAFVTLTSGSGVTFTLPPNVDVAFPIGTKIAVRQGGAGAVTMTAGSGVTMVKLAAKTAATGAIHSVVHATKLAVNTWIISGDLA